MLDRLSKWSIFALANNASFVSFYLRVDDSPIADHSKRYVYRV